MLPHPSNGAPQGLPELWIGQVQQIPEIIHIALGHRYAILQDGLRLNIAKFSKNLRVVVAASSAEDLFSGLRAHRTDLVIVGLDLPGFEGMAILKKLREDFPDLRVAVLTAKEETYRECLRHDVAGFILKREPAARIVKAIETIASGTFYATADVAGSASQTPSVFGDAPELSSRERETLILVAQGLRNTDIAERLGIRLRTVEFHKTNLKRKLQARTSGELIRIAYERKLIG